MLSQILELRRRIECDRERKRAKSKLAVEDLEGRDMLTAVTLTDYEQLLVELVNRARMDPLGEVDRLALLDDLNDGLDPGTITSTPKQPLATVQALIDAAKAHAADMLANNYFSHTSSPGGESPTDRAAAFGYSGSVGENIHWNGTTGTLDSLASTLQAHESLFMSPGHRANLMTDGYEELGVGVEFGQYTNGPQTYNAGMFAEGFGFNSDDPYLTGVVYDDSFVDDDFYSIGEGQGGVTVTAVDANGTQYVVSSGASGGYNLKLPSGTYTVTATGGQLEYVISDVVIGSANVKVDFDMTLASPITNTQTFDDILGYTPGLGFWVGESDGQDLTTSYAGTWASSVTYTYLGTGDFNGDGYDDVASLASNGAIVIGISTPGPSGGTSFVSTIWGSLSTSTAWSTIRIGDFNGDGRDDLLTRADTDGSIWLAASTGSAFNISYWTTYATVVQWQDVLVGDFNDDGIDDLAARAGDNTWWVSLGNSTGSRASTAYWGSWSTNVTWDQVEVGDFNGDGMDDVIGRANDSFWWVNSSTGSSFSMQQWGFWSAAVEWQDIRLGDFNGDGRDDVAGRANGQWWIAISQGNTFKNEYWGAWSTLVSWHDVRVMDMNGDGRDDLVGRAGNGQWWASLAADTSFDAQLVAQWSASAEWDVLVVGNFA